MSQNIVSTPPVGQASQDLTPENVFDDLNSVGLYPAEQRINKIISIEIFYQKLPLRTPFSGVVGIKTMYTLNLKDKSKPVVVTHGNTSGKSQTFKVEEDEFFVGISGKLYENFPVGKIRSLGVLVYNKASGQLTSRPSNLDVPGAHPYPEEERLPVVKLKSFLTLGLLVAFGGSLSNDEKKFLETLSVYKYTPGAGGIDII